MLQIYLSMEAWIATGTAAVDWLTARAEVDASRIGLASNSFGSFFGTIAATHEPRIRAVAVSAVCHEPGFHTIFEEASPTSPPEGPPRPAFIIVATGSRLRRSPPVIAGMPRPDPSHALATADVAVRSPQMSR